MKKLLLSFILTISIQSAQATIHTVQVWNGYFQFLPSQLTIQLGDTIQWLPLDQPTMIHTITSANIPSGAEEFDQTWQSPADTFFQYIPQFPGLYEYECTPHISLGMVANFTVEGTTTSTHGGPFLENRLIIYPNPATEIIKVGSNKNTEATIEIINTTGQVQLKRQANFKGQTIPINIQELMDGVFIVRVRYSDGKIAQQRVVKVGIN